MAHCRPPARPSVPSLLLPLCLPFPCGFEQSGASSNANFGWTTDSRAELLAELANLLLATDPDEHPLPLHVARLFRPIMPELLHRAVLGPAEQRGLSPSFSLEFHERCGQLFAALLPTYPQLLGTVLAYYESGTRPSPFERLLIDPAARATQPPETIRRVMRTALQLLQFDEVAFRPLWDWGPAFGALFAADELTRWYTARAVALVLGMSDHRAQQLLGRCGAAGSKFEVGETFRLGDRVAQQQAAVLTKPETGAGADGEAVAPPTFLPGDLQYMSDTGGVLLSHDTDCTSALAGGGGSSAQMDGDGGGTEHERFVPIQSAISNVQAAALALTMKSPILLSGPVGAGKTATAEHLCRKFRQDKLLKLQMGDQVDAKALLGTYTCTDTPGEFKYQAGTLVQAVVQGKWILIEDINLAPLDVISMLVPLLDTGRLHVPGRGETHVAARGFQLFATQRTDRFGNRPHSAASLLDNLFHNVNVMAPPPRELHDLVLQLHPELEGVIPRLLKAFVNLASSGQQDLRRSSKNPRLRPLSTRDLLKWCRRIASRRDPTLLDVFAEAYDCFCAALPKKADIATIAQLVGADLDIPPEQIEHYITNQKPHLQYADGAVQIGRTVLTIQTSIGGLAAVGNSNATFAHTRHVLCLIEQVTVAVNLCEPILLVGETGTGKTTAVQHLARLAHRKLIVVNMSQQSDGADLLGGFRPVDVAVLAEPAMELFERLFFQDFAKSKDGQSQNTKVMDTARKFFGKQKWQHLLVAFTRVLTLIENRFEKQSAKSFKGPKTPPHRRAAWASFRQLVSKFSMQLRQAEKSFAFSFVEGVLVKALRRGDWVLLDEINLASSETLECLNGILESPTGSVVLTERGDLEPVARDPNFRLFGCMNPATDVGKRDLPPGIRNRFTELYVGELTDSEDLGIVVKKYLDLIGACPAGFDVKLVQLYQEVRRLAAERVLRDGNNSSPHYSLRTLCRALMHAQSVEPQWGPVWAVFEGCCASFLTQLDRISHALVESTCRKILLPPGAKHLPRKAPTDKVDVFSHWLSIGTLQPVVPAEYIMTASVKENLKNLVRVTSSKRFPVLLQGPTSCGKTSMIEYLAKFTGHKFVRINNHEHTDIQEYLGSYVADDTGRLKFKEGALVEAARNGYWIVLDELNLAPTDVLEALNRLLDDNRELFLHETQTVVKPHPEFMLFATQNPPGSYGGRKVLSRAFRNRFVELHFEDIPANELKTILEKRCRIPPNFCNTLVTIMKDLQKQRQGTRLIAGKHGFITLRDLFRWAERYLHCQQTDAESVDHRRELANDGIMLLAERVREPQEKELVKACILKHLLPKVKQLDEEEQCNCDNIPLFQKLIEAVGRDDFDETSPLYPFRNVVWTKGMRRLFKIAHRCLEVKESLLLVGETGCGKTTICQILAALQGIEMYSINCHQNSETADFIGGLRPVRRSADEPTVDPDPEMEDQDASTAAARLFEWCDGPLVQAMQTGGIFLIDEISLAEDSVLERLNSVLEPSKTLFLAEKSGVSVESMVAHEDFRIVATMNPGGDFGKKELSPALRNRFTEIWVPSIDAESDLIEIVDHMLPADLKFLAPMSVRYAKWLVAERYVMAVVTLRDYVAWTSFISKMAQRLGPFVAWAHGACLVFLDAIGTGSTNVVHDSEAVVIKCLDHIIEVVPEGERASVQASLSAAAHQALVAPGGELWGIGPFTIECGVHRAPDEAFSFSAPTTAANAYRLLRAMQLGKPILLEGSPGVGKTSLVLAVAQAAGQKVYRLNLSEQTDIVDLFGSDLPVEGKVGEFAWRNGPLLEALEKGAWIVLDELNLASQSVLEGLNACLDHRGEIYVPELNRTFKCASDQFRLFACQNPLHQGGGRKGLPKSFLNRFTRVYAQSLTASDLLAILQSRHPGVAAELLQKMIQFNTTLATVILAHRKFGHGSGDFNLRDIFRWCDLLVRHQGNSDWAPEHCADAIFLARMRKPADREHVNALYKEIFGCNILTFAKRPQFFITPDTLIVGRSMLPREAELGVQTSLAKLSMPRHMLTSLEAVADALACRWLVNVVGPASAGKSNSIELLAGLTGNHLSVLSMNSSVDTMELLGGFEQVDLNRDLQRICDQLEQLAKVVVESILLTGTFTDAGSEQERIYQENMMTLLRFASSLPMMQRQGKPTSTWLKDKIERLVTLADGFTDCHRIKAAKLLAETGRLESFEGQSQSGAFEWRDGMLIDALVEGHWLMVDNVNFCAPSVLDRLNGLLEPGGSLVLNERGVINGKVIEIIPHPNFRLIFTMDPRNGEISRAMRNRSLELFLQPPTNDVTQLLGASGLPAHSLAGSIASLERINDNDMPFDRQFSGRDLRKLLDCGAMAKGLLARGSTTVQSTAVACDQLYGRVLGANQDVVALVQKAVEDGLARPEAFTCHPSLSTRGPVLQALVGAHPLLTYAAWPSQLMCSHFRHDSSSAMVFRDGALIEYLCWMMKANVNVDEQAEPTVADSATLPFSQIREFFWGNDGDVQDLETSLEQSTLENEAGSALDRKHAKIEAGTALLKAAISHFFAVASHSDWIYRCTWLETLAACRAGPTTGGVIAYMAKAHRDCFNSKVCVTLRDFSAGLGPTPDFMMMLPWNLQEVLPHTYSRLQATAAVGPEDRWVSFETLVARCKVILALYREAALEQAFYDRPVRMHQLSLMQQSYLLSISKLSEDRTTHQIVPLLVMYFNALDMFVTAACDPSCPAASDVCPQLELVLRERNRLWSICAGETDTHKEEIEHAIRVQFGRLQAALESCDKSILGLTAHLQNIHGRISTVLAENDFQSDRKQILQPLWRLRPFKNRQLFELYARLQESELAFDTVARARLTTDERLYPGDLTERSTLAHDGHRELRKSILEGAATVVALDHAGSRTDDPMADERQIPPDQQALHDRIAEVPASVDKLAAEASSVTTAAAVLQMELWPVNDYTSMVHDLVLLGKVFTLCSDQHFLTGKGQLRHQKLVTLAAELKQFTTTVAIASQTRPPHDFIHHQLAIWRIEAEGSSATIADGLRELAGAMLLSWFQRSWSTTYDDSMLCKDLEAKLGRENATAMAGPGRLLHCVATGLLWPIITWENTTIGTLEEKLAQCGSLQTSMASPSFTQLTEVDPLASDWRLLFGIFATTTANLAQSWLEAPIAAEVLQCIGFYHQCLEGSASPLGLDAWHRLRTLLHFSTGSAEADELLKVYMAAILNALEWYWSEALGKPSSEAPRSAEHCGDAWVNLGLLSFFLGVPSTAVDPAAEHITDLAAKRNDIRGVETRIEVESIPSDRNYASFSSISLLGLAELHDNTLCAARAVAEKVVLRPSPSDFPRLVREIDTFSTSMCSPKKVLEVTNQFLVMLRQTRDFSKASFVEQQEILLQENQSKFCNMLKREFPMYRDVTQPLLIATGQTQHGLRLLSRSVEESRRHQVSGVSVSSMQDSIVALARLPEYTAKLGSGLEVLTGVLSPSEIKVLKCIGGREYVSQLRPAVLRVVLIKVRNVMLLSREFSTDSLATLDAVCCSYMQCWEEMQDRRVQRELEKQALYKHKERSHNEDTEEAEAKRDFKRLFPDFTHEFREFMNSNGNEDELNELDNEEEAEEAEEAEEEDSWIWRMLEEIFHIHNRIFNSSAAVPGWQNPHVPPSQLSNRDVVEAVTSGSIVLQLALPVLVQRGEVTLDKELADLHAYRLKTFQAAASAGKVGMKTADGHGYTKPYNFYTDENIFEAQQINPVLKPLRAHICRLLEDPMFEENPTLVQLLGIIDRVLGFKANSPVIKFLYGLDMLLSRAQDWQRVAHRGISLVDPLQDVAELMIRWRKLELKRWPAILAEVEIKLRRTPLELWFKLYKMLGSIPKGVEDQTAGGAVDAHLIQIFDLVDTAFLTARLADFDVLLTMTKAFSIQTLAWSQSYDVEMMKTAANLGENGVANDTSVKATSSFRRKVANMMQNLWSYYLQFEVLIVAELTRHREKFEKELKDYVRIARWKDTNYSALKSSATKTHKKLHGVARKYEEALRTPITQQLRAGSGPDLARDVALARDDNAVAGAPPSDAGTGRPYKLVTLTATAGNSSGRFEAAIAAVGSDVVDELRSEVRDLLEKQPAYSNRVDSLLLKISRAITSKVCSKGRWGRISSIDGLSQKILKNVTWLQEWLDVQMANDKMKAAEAEIDEPEEESGIGTKRTFTDRRKHRTKEGAKIRSFTVGEDEVNTDKEDQAKKDKDRRKHLRLMKTTSLATLLKMLARIGLSHRAIGREQQSMQQAVRLSRVDMTANGVNDSGIGVEDPAAAAAEDGVSSEQTLLHTEVRNAWTKINVYAPKVLARMITLRAAAIKPDEALTRNETDRCVGFAEHLFHVQMQQRQIITEFLEEYRGLRVLLAGFEHGVDDGSLLPAAAGHATSTSDKHTVDKAIAMLKEAQLVVPGAAPATDDDMDESEDSASGSSVASCLAFSAEIKSTLDSLAWRSSIHVRGAGRGPAPCSVRDQHLSSSLHTKVKVLVEKIKACASDPATTQASNVVDSFNAFANAYAAERPAADQGGLMNGADAAAESSTTATFLAAFVQKYNSIVKHMLKGIANTASASSDAADKATGTVSDSSDDEALMKGHLLTLHKEFVAEFRALSLPQLIKKLVECSELMAARTATVRSNGVDDGGITQLCCFLQQQLFELLRTYSTACEQLVLDFSGYHKSVCKLEYILIGLFSDLLERGYCIPADETEGDAEEGHGGQELEGTGMADGAGNQDVSEQIEDEEQVAGQQDDQDDDQNDEPMPEEDNGIEMSNEFEGALHDVEQEEEDNDEDSDDDFDEEELDQQIGDMDENEADTNKDQKVGDDPDEKKEDLAEGEEDGGAKQGETELNAKSDDMAEQNPDDGKEEAPKPENEPEDDNGEDKINEDFDEASGDENESGEPAKQEQGEKPPDDLDLDEDLNLDDNDMNLDDDDDGDDAAKPDEDPNGEQEEDPAGDEMELSDTEGQDQQDGEDENADANKEEDPAGDAMDQDPDAPPGEEDNPDAPEGEKNDADAKEGEDENMSEDENGDDQDGVDEAAVADPNEEEFPNGEEEDEEPEGQAQVEDETGAPDPKEEDKEKAAAESEEKKAEDATVTVENDAGAPSAMVDDADPDAQDASDGRGGEHTTSSNVSDALGEQQSSATQPEANPDKNKSERKLDSNPYRSIGDALKAWKDRVQVQDAESNDAPQDEADADETELGDTADAYEHLQDDSAKADAQVVDSATAEQQQKAAQPDELSDGEGEDMPEPMRLEKPADQQEAVEMETELAEPKAEEDSGSGDSKQNPAVTQPELGADEAAADVGRDPSDKERSAAFQVDPDTLMPEDRAEAADGDDEGAGATFDPADYDLTEEDVSRIRDELEEKLTAHELGDAAALETWSRFEMITSRHSQDLCEQLRLILEASLAAKLEGDYRTGKRLNLRRIIPYIASQFRKDKIWLRRTKPSKREYQVMVAIDDSYSMQKYHSKQLALESLAVISNAMTLLEVGELGVMSFGASCNLVHPFGRPMTSQSGATMLKNFTFAQQHSHVGDLLKQAHATFLEAKSRYRSNSGLKISQLLFVISDSDQIHQEGEAMVERWFREVGNAGVFIVFVIIDSPEKEHSIMDQLKCEFNNGKLEMNDYMDRFADKKYVIVRDIVSLPAKVSDALRQWFEHASNSSAE